MIQQIDVHEVACLIEPFREMDVLCAWTWISGRMVVQKDEGCRIHEKCIAENGPTVDGSLRECSFGQHLLVDDLGFPVQEYSPDLFMVERLHPVM